MRIVGCDLHTRQQTLAMLDATTGEMLFEIFRGSSVLQADFRWSGQ